MTGHLLAAEHRLWRAAVPLESFTIMEVCALADVPETTARRIVAALVLGKYVLITSAANARRGLAARFRIAPEHRSLLMAPSVQRTGLAALPLRVGGANTVISRRVA